MIFSGLLRIIGGTDHDISFHQGGGNGLFIRVGGNIEFSAVGFDGQMRGADDEWFFLIGCDAEIGFTGQVDDPVIGIEIGGVGNFTFGIDPDFAAIGQGDHRF